MPPSTFDVGGEPGVSYELSLAIYDVRGSRVKTLVDGKLEYGRRVVVRDGRSEAGDHVS